MIRVLFIPVLCVVCITDVQADTSIYDDIRKQHRSVDALNADAAYCDERLGAILDGEITPPAYKQCMMSRGWRYRVTNRAKTWIDPATGSECREGDFFGLKAAFC
jgi:hypothetical protein